MLIDRPFSQRNIAMCKDPGKPPQTPPKAPPQTPPPEITLIPPLPTGDEDTDRGLGSGDFHGQWSPHPDD